MLQFAKGGMVPPGGVFFYADPANGVPLIQHRDNLQALVAEVRATYAGLGKAPPEPLAAVVEAYICERVPRGFCIGQYSGNPPDFMSPQAVRSRTRDAANAFPKVDPGTSLARMAICGMCESNSKVLCLSCTGLTDWAVQLAGRTRVAQDSSMGICKWDRVLVSLLVSLNRPGVSSDGRPKKCWRLNGTVHDSK